MLQKKSFVIIDSQHTTIIWHQFHFISLNYELIKNLWILVGQIMQKVFWKYTGKK